MGLAFTLYGILCFVVIPSSYLLDNLPLFNLSLTSLFFGLVVGLISLVQHLVPGLASAIADAACYIQSVLSRNQRPRQLQHVVQKNMRAHKQRNQKIGLMFVTTVTFLLFVRRLAKTIGDLALSSAASIMSGDIVLLSEAPWEYFDDPAEAEAHQALQRRLPAQELRELLDQHSEENQGPVTAYHFQSSTLADALG